MCDKSILSFIGYHKIPFSTTSHPIRPDPAIRSVRILSKQILGYRQLLHQWREAIHEAEMRDIAGVKVSQQRQNLPRFDPDRPWSSFSNPSRENI
jgi:hypothetical protein